MADNHKAKAEAMLGRAGYARGGATKGKHTTVNVVVASPPGGSSGPAMPPHPMLPPAGAMPPHPPMAPPGAPPMGAPPPGGPPPGMMPPGPRARGGATPYSSGKPKPEKKTAVDALRAAGYKTGGKVDDGGLSGEGRLEKIKAYGKK